MSLKCVGAVRADSDIELKKYFGKGHVKQGVRSVEIFAPIVIVLQPQPREFRRIVFDHRRIARRIARIILFHIADEYIIEIDEIVPYPRSPSKAQFGNELRIKTGLPFFQIVFSYG
jgi:hypothetical protein